MKKTIVIAISAISGGGKTTIVNELSNLLENSKIISFDDYDLEGPEDFVEWAKRGGDYNEWDISPIVDDINKICDSNYNSIDWIIMDYPFSYIHKGTKDILDFSIYIDTPLDIAMARRSIRDELDEDVNVFDMFRAYLNGGREAYIIQTEKVKPSCDFVIDGAQILGAIVDEIVNVVRNK